MVLNSLGRNKSLPKGSDYLAIERGRLLKDARKVDRELRRELFFEFFVVTKMFERFENDLAELDVEQAQADEIMLGAKDLSKKEIYAALSYPHELRERFLKKILDRVSSGEIRPKGLLREMSRIAQRNGYSVGFHMSKFDIRESGKGWAVIGREQDHRDDDLPMAYYSREFKHLYRRKLTNYMYIVRAEDMHRVGADGKWWRAPSLSIVQQISVDELRKGLDDLDLEMRSQAREEGAPMDEEE